MVVIVVVAVAVVAESAVVPVGFAAAVVEVVAVAAAAAASVGVEAVVVEDVAVVFEELLSLSSVLVFAALLRFDVSLQHWETSFSHCSMMEDRKLQSMVS